jgi:uncharacterized protein YwgA
VTNTKFLPLALLYVNGGRQVDGITRLQKLVFLAQQEKLDEDEDGYDFAPYKYGPYSAELTHALELFEDRGYVNKTVETTRNGNEKYTYSLTDDGRKMVKQGLLGDGGNNRLFEAAEAVKDAHNREPIERVLRYVYNKYPSFAEQSELDI